MSEYCRKPCCGFILQAASIPSKDAKWTAIQSIDTHTIKLVDNVEDFLFTSHTTLNTLKMAFENNPFASFTLNGFRDKVGLRKISTWPYAKEKRVPIVIPIQRGTFELPADWWPEVQLTDFIFLRGKGCAGKLGEPLSSFISDAKARGDKLCVMSFSSMPVSAEHIMQACCLMVNRCKHQLSLIFVGVRPEAEVEPDLDAEYAKLMARRRLLEVERADFGILFDDMDCFVVHGGLGTTVEALRRKKPVAVTGTLLMDQRWWGNLVHQKGVGPECQVMKGFLDTCVDFVNGALDPADPHGWQRKAKELDLGDDGEDGVSVNVAAFQKYIR